MCLAKVMHADGFSRLVAIKLLHRRWSENKEIAQRMRDEARLLGWLRHRNIVDVIDLTSIDGRAAVIMEYLEAVDMKTVVQALAEKGERIPPYAALEVVSFVASALDAAYNRPPYEGEKPLRVIHRDIKPSNIMIDESATVKVLDFGVARGEFENRESHTQELNFGSVEYMPPERLFFEPETDRADVYSLGATLFEFLAGERLGKAKGRAEKHKAFLEDRLSFLAARCPLPNPQGGDAATLIRDMCAYNADHRPTAETVVTRARALSRQMPGPALSEFAEQVVKPLVAEFSRAPREPNPLTEKVLPEDSTLFGAVEAAALVEASGVMPRVESPPPGEGEGVADVPRDDARWDALRRAALAEMEAAASVATAPALDGSLGGLTADDYGDEPTRVGEVPGLAAARAAEPAAAASVVAPPVPDPVVVPGPVSSPAAVAPMVAVAPPPVDDLAPESMLVVQSPPGMGATSAPMPRAAAKGKRKGVAALSAGSAGDEPAPALNLALPPGNDSGLDPVSAEVAIAPPSTVSASAPAEAPRRPAPVASNLTFMPEPAPDSGRLGGGLTMVPLDESDDDQGATVSVPTASPPAGSNGPAPRAVSQATMVPADDLFPPMAEASTPAIREEAAPTATVPAVPKAPSPRRVDAVPPTPASPPRSTSPRARPPQSSVPPQARPAPAVVPPEPAAPASGGSSLAYVLGAAAVLGILGGLLIAALILGYGYLSSRTPAVTVAPAASAPAPNAAPTPSPVAPAAVQAPTASGPNDVTFVSAAADTLKISVSCSGTDTTGTSSVVVPGPVSGPCLVKLVKKDRSRILADVPSPAAGTYTCFAGDAKACVQ